MERLCYASHLNSTPILRRSRKASWGVLASCVSISDDDLDFGRPASFRRTGFISEPTSQIVSKHLRFRPSHRESRSKSLEAGRKPSTGRHRHRHWEDLFIVNRRRGDVIGSCHFGSGIGNDHRGRQRHGPGRRSYAHRPGSLRVDRRCAGPPHPVPSLTVISFSAPRTFVVGCVRCKGPDGVTEEHFQGNQRLSRGREWVSVHWCTSHKYMGIVESKAPPPRRPTRTRTHRCRRGGTVR